MVHGGAPSRAERPAPGQRIACVVRIDATERYRKRDATIPAPVLVRKRRVNHTRSAHNDARAAAARSDKPPRTRRSRSRIATDALGP
jgi:hypothetical protein